MDLRDVIVFIVSFVCTFTTVALRGWQHKNVIGHHVKSIAIVAYFIYVFDFVAMYIIIKNNPYMVLVSGLAASLAMVLTVTLHDRFYKRKELSDDNGSE